MPMCTSVSGTGKIGAVPSRKPRNIVATATAATTGMKLRGRHSNSSSSTASSAAASGELKVAAIPPAAPATSKVLRSSAESRKAWARIEPMAPPVMMIGPSAPKGPPVPMLTAADTGFSTATRGATRLPPVRIASIASGMPCPRIFSEPNRAIRPTMRPPNTGANSTRKGECWCPPGATKSVLRRW